MNSHVSIHSSDALGEKKPHPICEMGPYLTYIPGHMGLTKDNSIQGKILIR